MTNPTPAFGRVQSAQSDPDKLEQAVSEALTRLVPGHPNDVRALLDELRHLAVANACLIGLSPDPPSSTVEQALAALRPSVVVDNALQETSRAYVAALAQDGLAPAMAESLLSWLEVSAAARLVQHQIELRRVIDCLRSELAAECEAAVLADPTQPLSAA